MFEEKERTMNMLKYIVGTRNSNNPYLDPNRAGEFHAHVMNHMTKGKAKRSKVLADSKTACPILNCGGFGDKKCRSKSCSLSELTFCKLHAKHEDHAKKDLKPSTNVSIFIKNILICIFLH